VVRRGGGRVCGKGWPPGGGTAPGGRGVLFALGCVRCASRDRCDRGRSALPPSPHGGRRAGSSRRRAERSAHASDDRRTRGTDEDTGRSRRGGGARLRCASVTDTRVATRRRGTSCPVSQWGVLSS